MNESCISLKAKLIKKIEFISLHYMYVLNNLLSKFLLPLYLKDMPLKCCYMWTINKMNRFGLWYCMSYFLEMSDHNSGSERIKEDYL